MRPKGMPCPSAAPVLAQLKGFQRAAVETAFERLYLAPDSARRFLVADEVGLGKTLIARGLVAKVVEHLWDTVERIDVVYLCSNARIAKQNISRLNPFDGLGVAEADRITMLPVRLSSLAGNDLNFVAFTPGTSLDLKSSEGQRRERALLFWLLHGHWHHGEAGAKNVLQGGVKRQRWRRFLDGFPEENPISEEMQGGFRSALDRADDEERAGGGDGLRARFGSLCERFQRGRETWPDAWRLERRELIGELRVLLARACVEHLQPDLVILDEFQRFKDLLDPEAGGEAARLAQALFNWGDESAQARVLLLSATPYKMYTLAHEAHEDDHYADFLRTVDFLEPDAARQAGLRRSLVDYRRELYRLGAGGGEGLLAVKASIEGSLRRVMSRTERLGAGGARDGMLRTVPSPAVELQARDVVDFVHLQRVADQLEQRNVVEFWKSAPYLLNFMEDYGLKRELEKELGRRAPDAELVACLAAADGLLLDGRAVRRYEPVDPANGRLRALLADLFDDGLWRCLWLPPSRPSHALGGPFAGAAARPGGATKRLVFSAWTVVPKVIAALLSYELERRAFHELGGRVRNTPAARKKRAPLLRFGRSEGRLSGMPVLALAYPSVALARLGDPVDVARELGGVPTADAVLAAVAARIERALAPILATLSLQAGGQEEDAWYWQAPILLDRAADLEATEPWWSARKLAKGWASSGADDDDDGGRIWAEHVQEAAAVALGEHVHLGRPPADLVATLARMAVAGPAVCAWRAMDRVLDVAEAEQAQVKSAAGRIGFAFRSLFNRPEAMALLRAGKRETPYWRLVLGHGVDGDLDAVLSEHVHILRDLQGLFDTQACKAADRLAEVLGETLSIRASAQPYDMIRVPRRGGEVELQRSQRNLRGHVAMRFSTEKGEDEAGGVRADTVRDAFNSPFWPFVLTTTSVGQEGLDFHAWCHAVVHWNLPSNPVDLEQREGRVHRFKGHAIRKNLASRHGRGLAVAPGEDPWRAMFERALAELDDDARGLVPWWVYPLEGGAHIERHVPLLPLSKDVSRLEALRRSLAVYRMVFGQPRQDDLLAYLLEHVPREEIERRMGELRVELAPG